MPEQTQQGRAARFASNVRVSIAGQVLLWIVSFAITPYLVRNLGKEIYGLYLLLILVSGYLLLLTLCSQHAVIKYLSEFRAADNRAGFWSVVRYGAWAHACAAAAGTVLLYFGAGFCVDKLFNIPPEMRSTAVWVMRCAAASSVGIIGL